MIPKQLEAEIEDVLGDSWEEIEKELSALPLDDEVQPVIRQLLRRAWNLGAAFGYHSG